MYPPFGGIGPYGTYGNLGLYGALVPYGTLNLTQVSPAQSFVEPLLLSDVQSYLQLPPRSPADPGEVNLLNFLISAARLEAEVQQNRDLVVKQWDLALDYWPGYRVELRAPTRSVDLVQFEDSNGNFTTMVPNVDYVPDVRKNPGCITPPFNAVTWPVFMPWPSSAILVRFTSGFAANDPWWQETGGIVKAGMLRLISDWYNNRLPVAKGSGAMSDYVGYLSYGKVTRVR